MPHRLKRPASPPIEQRPSKKPRLDAVDRASLQQLPNSIRTRPNALDSVNSTPVIRDVNVEQRPIARPQLKEYRARVPSHRDLPDRATSNKRALVLSIDEDWGPGWYRRFRDFHPTKKTSPMDLAQEMLREINHYAQRTDIDTAAKELRASVKLRQSGKYYLWKHLKSSNQAAYMIVADWKHLNDRVRL